MSGPEARPGAPEFQVSDFIRQMVNADTNADMGLLTFADALALLKDFRTLYEVNKAEIKRNPTRDADITEIMNRFLAKVKALNTAATATVTPTSAAPAPVAARPAAAAPPMPSPAAARPVGAPSPAPAAPASPPPIRPVTPPLTPRPATPPPGTPPHPGAMPPTPGGSGSAALIDSYRDQIREVKRRYDAAPKGTPTEEKIALRHAEALFTAIKDELKGASGITALEKGELGIEMKVGDDEKEPNEMTQLERIAELKRLGYNPVLNNYSQTGADDRARRVGRAFILALNEVKNVASDPAEQAKQATEKRSTLTEQVLFLLDRVDGKLTENASASRKRAELSGVLREHLLSRGDILAATTYHPVWGHEVRHMLDEAIKDAAAETTKFSKTPRPAYQFEDKDGKSQGPEFNYTLLVGDKGSYYLDQYFKTKFPRYDEKAREAAALVFKVFDYVDIVLAQKQRIADGTRNHNGDEAKKLLDPIFATDPVASFVQNWIRHPGATADWRAWFLAFVEDVPDGLYGPQGKASEIREIQKLIRLWFNSHFPVDIIVRQPVAGYCESYFPDTRDLLKLAPAMDGSPYAESLDLRPYGGNLVRGDKAGSIVVDVPYNWDSYDQAMIGWQRLIEFSIQGIDGIVTEDTILKSSGEGKKGLLNEFVSAASQAKTFAPKHLEKFLGPMLTLFCARLIQGLRSDATHKREVRDKIIKELTISATITGMKSYGKIIGEVIVNLRNNELCQLGPSTRYKQNEAYINALWIHQEKQKSNKYLPKAVETVGGLRRKDPEQELHRELIKSTVEFPEAPILRKGTMFDKGEK